MRLILEIDGDEVLYRRVLADSNHVTLDAEQRHRVSSSAFGDPGGKPSVDLASLCAGPTWTQDGAIHGVLSLLTHQVRAVRLAGKTEPPKGSAANAPKVQVEHAIDVHHDPVTNRPPLRDNPAHAEIRPAPHWCNPSVFKRLKERLARLAVVVILPAPLR